MRNMKLLARLRDTDGENRFYCSGKATLAKLAELEAEGLVRKYTGVGAGGIRHFRITATGKRALVKLSKAATV